MIRFLVIVTWFGLNALVKPFTYSGFNSFIALWVKVGKSFVSRVEGYDGVPSLWIYQTDISTAQSLTLSIIAYVPSEVTAYINILHKFILVGLVLLDKLNSLLICGVF